MTHSITWVVNFCSQNCLEGKNNFINASWYKYSDAYDLFNLAGHAKEDVKLISDYFEKQSYKELLLRFWHNDDIINIEKFNLIIISDRENLYQATLFSYFFKKAGDFLINIGLSGRSFKKSYLINFWEHAWSTEDYDKNMNSLYELSLFQNLNVGTRPYDLVFIYKNTNEGISNFGKYWETGDQNYHASRTIQLVSYLSTSGTNSVITQDIEKWCRAFGGLLIYSDAEKIYKMQAQGVFKILLSSLKSEEKGLWSIDYGKIKLEQVTEGLNASKIFLEISSKVNAVENIEPFNSADAWDWFSVKRLKAFFEDTIKMILFKTKESKISFILESYKQVKDKVDANLEKVKVETGKTGIPTPQQIFNDYFRTKPFSIASLKAAITDLITHIENKRQQHMALYESGYANQGQVFMPFALADSARKEFDYTLEQFRNQDESKSNEEEKKLIELIEKKSAEIPHPISLLIKTFFLSTIIVMLTFIPLKIVLEEDVLGQIITYSSLTILFVLPFYFIWNKYKNAIESLSNLILKFEVMLKYNLLRRTNQYIFRKIDAYFEEYLNKCTSFLKEVELFCNENELSKDSLSGHDPAIVSLCSVKPVSEIVKEIPTLKITVDQDNYIINVVDLTSNKEHIYKLYDMTVRKGEIGLTEILKNAQSILSDKIALNIENTPGNTNTLSDIIFNSGNNLKREKSEELLDVIPPFNGIISDEIISIEVSCVVSENNQVKKNIQEFLSPLNINDYREKYDNDGIKGELNILSLNSPRLGIKTLFSLNIKESFYDRTQKYFNTHKERLEEILDKLYLDIVRFYGESLPNKFIDSSLVESSYKHCYRGFDGMFEVDFDNIRIGFSKTFKEYNEDKINERVSKYLQEMYRNDTSNNDQNLDSNT